MYPEAPPTTVYHPKPVILVRDLVPLPLPPKRGKRLTPAELDARDAADCARRNADERHLAKPFVPRCK